MSFVAVHMHRQLSLATDTLVLPAEQVQALFRDHIVQRAPIEVVARAQEEAAPAK